MMEKETKEDLQNLNEIEASQKEQFHNMTKGCRPCPTYLQNLNEVAAIAAEVVERNLTTKDLERHFQNQLTELEIEASQKEQFHNMTKGYRPCPTYPKPHALKAKKSPGRFF